MRLDQRVFVEGLTRSRSRAQAMIRAGMVLVDGQAETRPGRLIPEEAAVALAGDACPWVSRGGLKLAHALDQFRLSPAGRTVLDLGASTGGFTEVCLDRGARRVYAVDVGRDQLDPSLRADPRVADLSGLHARDVDAVRIPEPIEFLVADLSFISLAKALPAPLELTTPEAVAVLLVKPQFEVGPKRVGKGGVVKDPAARDDAEAGVRAALAGLGWRVLDVCVSPILGGDGNEERLLAARRVEK